MPALSGPIARASSSDWTPKYRKATTATLVRVRVRLRLRLRVRFRVGCAGHDLAHLS